MTDEPIQHYKFVPHHQTRKWEELGWVYAGELGPPHCAYSCLYAWPFDGEPIVPADSEPERGGK